MSESSERGPIGPEPTGRWLEARQEASAILDQFMIALRRTGSLSGSIPNASGPGGPYVECINALADLIAAPKS